RRRQLDGARGGRLDAGEDPQQRRLAGPVRADETDDGAGADGQVEAGEQRAWAVRGGELPCDELGGHPAEGPTARPGISTGFSRRRGRARPATRPRWG